MSGPSNKICVTRWTIEMWSWAKDDADLDALVEALEKVRAREQLEALARSLAREAMVRAAASVDLSAEVIE